MANFETIPLTTTIRVGVAAGSKVDHQPRVLTANFGDGYSARARDGLNADPATFSARFTNLTRTEAGVIDAFLSRMGGVTAFLFTVPGEASPRQWTCPRWGRSYDNKGVDGMDAQFIENFDP